MKWLKTEDLLMALLFIVAFVLWINKSPDSKTVEPEMVEVAVPEGQTLEITKEQEEVFRRAFWRHPSSGDVIVHAERREWSDDAGVARWQWFMELEPSEALNHDLLDLQRFPLREQQSERSWSMQRPSWFPQSSAGFRLLESEAGEMAVIIDESRERWFATGGGSGFARGADRPQARSSSGLTVGLGRLPTTSPPNPTKP